MKKLSSWKWIVFILVGILGLFLSLYILRGVETREIDHEARSDAEGEFITLKDGVTHYFLGGPDGGPLVVFVHGFSVPSYVWEPTCEALNAAGYQTLRYDLYGRGYSDRPDIEYTHELFSRQLSGLISGLGLSKPKVLVGLSMGGPIASSYVADQAEESIGLVLIAPEIMQPTRGEIFPLNLPLVGEYLMAAVMEPYVLPKLQSGDFYHPEQYPAWEALYRPQFQFKGTGRALLSTVRRLTEFDPEEIYQDVYETGVPVLLIWGKEDQTIGWDQIIVLQEIIPDMETYVVLDAGHLAHYEKAEEVNSRILEFLIGLEFVLDD